MALPPPERLDRAKVNQAVRDGLKLGPLRPARTEDRCGVPKATEYTKEEGQYTSALPVRSYHQLRMEQSPICRAALDLRADAQSGSCDEVLSLVRPQGRI